MKGIHELTFADGGAVEFARLMKAIKEEAGFDTRLLMSHGRFPANGPETITLTLQTADFTGTTDELREKISRYVPVKKDGKKAAKES